MQKKSISQLISNAPLEDIRDIQDLINQRVLKEIQDLDRPPKSIAKRLSVCLQNMLPGDFQHGEEENVVERADRAETRGQGAVIPVRAEQSISARQEFFGQNEPSAIRST